MCFKYGKKELIHLSKVDPVLGKYIKERGNINRPIEEDHFYSLVSSIISQLISKTSAETIMNNLKNYLKEITPEKFLNSNKEALKNCGISYKKIEWIKNISKKIVKKELDFSRLYKMSNEEIINELTKLDGIGRWSAEMFLIFSLNRLDVISYGDLGIRRGIEKLYNIKNLDKKTFDKITEKYSPYKSVASLYLWEYGSKKTPAYYKTSLGYIIIKVDGDSLEELYIKADKPKYQSNKTKNTDMVFKQIDEYLKGKRKEFDLKLKIKGTPFQTKVWNELLKIPYGKTTSYKKIAERVNNPKACRAVGMANNKNKISIVIPCHRVIGANNTLVGYGGGLDVKKKLLHLEEKYK